MSDFATSMAGAWESSLLVFGDTIVFVGSATEYDCVVHDLKTTTEVVPGSPGRRSVLNGRVVMKQTDWAATGAAKGAKVTVGGAEARIINDPNVGYTSDTAIIELGPRT